MAYTQDTKQLKETAQGDPVGSIKDQTGDRSDTVIQGHRKSSADAITPTRHDIEITDGISPDDMVVRRL